jgi:glycosyltransferase involved in cell wall biosynthesis
MNKYLVLIPAFNEGAVISTVLSDVKTSLPEADILVVNDGSTDQTYDIAKNAGVMVLDIPCNIGYGGALQTGFRFASEHGYQYVITMDGDAQHDPVSAHNLMEVMDRSGADVVVGSRFLSGHYRMPFARRIGVWLFSRIAYLHTGARFTDPTSGFQLLNRKAFSYFSEGNNYPLDYPDVNIIMALHKMKFRVTEAPVTMREKRGGKSMHSGVKPLFYVVRMFLAILMVVLRKEE